MIKPYYDQDGITIYHGDCREILPHLPKVDLVLTDPPYGLGNKWTGGTWFTRNVYATDKVEWDTEAPQAIVDEIVRLNIPTIIWGGNYFYLPISRCWLSWSKINSMPTMSDIELAWTNFDKPSKQYRSLRNGWERQHPTEKPISLMNWCVQMIDANTILDPFMGSGTTLVAAKQLHRKAIGIEIEEKYCEIAVKRLGQGVLDI